MAWKEEVVKEKDFDKRSTEILKTHKIEEWQTRTFFNKDVKIRFKGNKKKSIIFEG